MDVYIPSKNSVITIGSGFDNTIYSEDEKLYSMFRGKYKKGKSLDKI